MKRILAWWTFERLVMLLVVLNLVDAASTHILLHMGGPTMELNPLMRWAYSVGPAEFWLLKIALVTAGLTIIGKLATESLARRITFGAICFYLVVIFTHIQGWVQYLR